MPESFTTVEMTAKEAGAKGAVEATENHVAVTQAAVAEDQRVSAESYVFVHHHEHTEATTEAFTRDVFEGALDKVSRPLKGRFAHVPYTSDDLIRDKRAEVELEDR